MSDQADSASERQECATKSPLRILVVEDDLSILHISTTVLTRSGYKVDAAADGAEAWKALKSGTYDLMITDNNMPKVSGMELIKKVRAAHMALPVIMATGMVPEEELARAPWLQPQATLIKPYSTRELVNTVKLVLKTTTPSSAQMLPSPNWQPAGNGVWVC